MRYRRAMQAARAQGGAQSNEIAVPLPLRGLFVEARSAEVSGLFAGELHNCRSTGLAIETREPFVIEWEVSTALQRIPFEFGDVSDYILLKSSQGSIGSALIDRAFDGKAMAAYISGNVVIADVLGAPIRYNGTTIEAAGFTTSNAKDPAELDSVIAHHDRIIAWDSGRSLDFWYGGVGAITGVLTHFPLSRLGNITGALFNALPLTVSAGNSIADTLALITTTGEIVLYRGIDPGDAADWELVSRVKVAPPLSKFGFTRVGSDVWMISSTGLVSIRDSIARGTLALVSELSRAISDEILSRARLGGDWQLHTAADGSAVIINHVLGETSRQFIYYTESQAWATADYPVRAWHNLGRRTEFTTLSGHVGAIDPLRVESESIQMRLATSWFRLPRRSGIAYLTPHILGRGPITLRVWVLSDHNETQRDLDEAEQTVTMDPEEQPDPGGIISVSDEIAVDASGDVFKLIMEIEAPWAQIVNLKAGVF